MIFNKREKTALLVLLIAVVSGVFIFNKSISDKQTMANNNPCDLLVPTPKAVLSIQKISLLKGLLSTPIMSILETNSDPGSMTIAYYDNTEVVMIQTDRENASKIIKSLDKKFPFMAEKKSYGPVTISYYAETNSRYLSCYYHQGVFVISYDINMVKHTIRNSMNGGSTKLNGLCKLIEESTKDRGAELFINGDACNISLQFEDSTVWKPKQAWIETNLYRNENGDLCGYAEQELYIRADSIFSTNLTDTIIARLNLLFPERKATVDVSQDSTMAYISVCLK